MARPLPPQIDIKKLPAGHCSFSASNSSENGIFLCWGHPYDMTGKQLQADVSWLRVNNYVVNPDIIRIMKEHQTVAPVAEEVKHCTQCSAKIAMGAKFCQECGTPQTVVWTPGQADAEAQSLLNLIDPANPIGSLAAINAPQSNQKRQTPDEIFRTLNRNEANNPEVRAAAGEVGGKVVSEVNEYGTIAITKAPKTKKATA